MRHLLVASALVSLLGLLGGCVVVPVGPPGGAYYGPRVVVPAPALVVRPWYYRRGYGD